MDDPRKDPLRPTNILKANLRSLMKESRRYTSLSTIKKIVAASGGSLANGTVGRMTKGDSPTDIDKLWEVAKVFDLQPWQLLVPGIRAESLPVLADQKFLDNIRELVNKPESTPAPVQSEQKFTVAKRAALAKRDMTQAPTSGKGRRKG